MQGITAESQPTIIGSATGTHNNNIDIFLVNKVIYLVHKVTKNCDFL